jgi:hypothetical protein
MSGDDNPDAFDVAAGARKLAIDTAIRALIDHASATDPGLRDRVEAAIDAHIAGLDPKSDLGRDFGVKAKAYTAGLVRRPAR